MFCIKANRPILKLKNCKKYIFSLSRKTEVDLLKSNKQYLCHFTDESEVKM